MGVEQADLALAALEDAEDVAAAHSALADSDSRVSLADLAREFGISLDE